jgi:photosystem II stability/assembly factor-like uncharacterized protein
MTLKLRVETRQDLLYLLAQDSEFEHSLACQYLFAAFSLKEPDDAGTSAAEARVIDRWRQTLLDLAVEKLFHLGVASNLRMALGGAPHLRRAHFPQHRIYTLLGLDFRLAGWSDRTLRRLVGVEQPATLPTDSIYRRWPVPGHEPIDWVEIHVGAGCPSMRAARRNPSLRPRRLAYDTPHELHQLIAAGFQQLYPGKDDALFIGTERHRTSFLWKPLQHVTTREEAARALDAILGQGKTPPRSASASTSVSMGMPLPLDDALLAQTPFGRLVALYTEHVAGHGGTAPARAVVENPLVALHDDVPAPEAELRIPLGADTREAVRPTLITAEPAHETVELFVAVYELALQVLLRYLAHDDESEEQRHILQQVFLGLMHSGLIPLGSSITRLPAFSDQPDGPRAGPSFELSSDLALLPERRSAWRYFIERLSELAAACEALAATALSAPHPELRRALLGGSDHRRRPGIAPVLWKHALLVKSGLGSSAVAHGNGGAPPPETCPALAPPTWHSAIRSLFTDDDIRGMKRVHGLDLGDYQSVKSMARAIYEQVDRGAMPPGRPWPLEHVACFKRWMDAGCPLGEESALLAPRWHPTGAPHTGARYDDLWFLDPLVGWTINSSGQILHTRDGGATWALQFQTPVIDDRPIYLSAIAFATPAKGWVGTLCSTHRLYHTSDGGQRWSVVTGLPSAAPTEISSLFAVDERVVYAAGIPDPHQAPRMMKTVDGGERWTAWDMSPHASMLLDLHFFDAEHGLVVGGQSDRTRPRRADLQPVILYTSDGGQTWDNRIAGLTATWPSGAWSNKIFFLDERVGFVSLTGRRTGAILKTRDGGRSWQRLPALAPHGNSDLQGLGFVDEHHGWVGGWGDRHDQGSPTSETRDGGQSFTEDRHVGKFIRRFRFLGRPATVGFAAGASVYKYSTEPAGESSTVQPPRIPPALCPLRDQVPVHFRGNVSVRYTLRVPTERVWLHIWDQFGTLVRTLAADQDPAVGEHTFHWDGTDDQHEPVDPGFFVYRLTVDGVAESRVIHFSR